MMRKWASLLVGMGLFVPLFLQAHPCSVFEITSRFPKSEDFLSFLSEKNQKYGVSALSPEALGQLSRRQREKLNEELENFLSDLARGKIQGMDQKFENLFSHFSPRLPRSRSEAELRYLERWKFLDFMTTTLEENGMIAGYMPSRKKMQAARKVLVALGNTSSLWSSVELRMIVPFFKEIHISLDPATNPRVRALLDKAKTDGFESVRPEFYEILKNEGRFIKDPVMLEATYNHAARLFSSKVLALTVLGLRAYFLYATPNETAADGTLKELGKEVEESRSQKDEYFQEKLKILGIDPNSANPEDREAYREAYRQYYGIDPPVRGKP
jgi:hypothetical protein